MESAVNALLRNDATKRQGRFAPVVYQWSLGVWILFGNQWKHVVKKNTRQGFKLISTITEMCESMNVKFSVYVQEPEGCRALEVVLDVPSVSSDRAKQRACVELPTRERVDLLEWLESYVPRA